MRRSIVTLRRLGSMEPEVKLLSYEEALRAVLSGTQSIQRTEAVDLELARGRVLAEPVVARQHYPRFDNSSVDGYALHAADLESAQPLASIESVAAGATPTVGLTPGHAARILTGAPIPQGTGAIIMQEDVSLTPQGILLGSPVALGANMRLKGADYQPGDLLLPSGSQVTSGVGGLLASEGLIRPVVFAKPRVTVFATGDELVPYQEEPGPAQLRDSNAPMLAMALGDWALVKTQLLADDRELVVRSLTEAAQDSDAVVVAGGASVGDRDFMADVIRELGQLHFHGIRIRPGKPVLFGEVNGKPVLGLPGNPASAYVTFQLFGLPMIRKLAGIAKPASVWSTASFGESHAAEWRDVFPRVTLTGGVATPVREQGSFGLRSLVEAEGLVHLRADTAYGPGDPVPFLALSTLTRAVRSNLPQPVRAPLIAVISDL